MSCLRYILKCIALSTPMTLLGACGDSGGDAASPPEVTQVPQSLTTMAADGQVTISWDIVYPATSYNLYWNTSGNVSKSDNKIINVTSPYIHDGYTNDTMYYYAVTAVNSGVESELSAEGVALSTLMSNVVFVDANLQTCVDAKAAMWSFEITGLDCSSKNISDLSGIEKLTGLSDYLYLGNNTISNLNPLATLTNVVNLDLRNNSISDVTPLASLPNLRSFSVGGNNISDFGQFSTFKALSSLGLSNSGISDVSVISSAVPDVQTLFLDNNNISDLTPFSKFTWLSSLTLSNNNLSDISQLSSLTSLVILSLENNSISDVSQLASLTNITNLYLSGNNITTGVASLVTLDKITTVTLGGNNNIPCSDLTILVNALGSAVTEPTSCI